MGLHSDKAIQYSTDLQKDMAEFGLDTDKARAEIFWETIKDAYDDGLDARMTWQDIRRIVQIADELITDASTTLTEEEYYTRILEIYENNTKDN